MWVSWRYNVIPCFVLGERGPVYIDTGPDGHEIEGVYKTTVKRGFVYTARCKYCKSAAPANPFDFQFSVPLDSLQSMTNFDFEITKHYFDIAYEEHLKQTHPFEYEVHKDELASLL